ncbi:hypothetical protein [Micrococcus sp. NPDC078436]|uniref:hypothetical protein n=1 Tax=Micrococcus sp. NPDC078436 TaxID=3154960 RepID=UPI002609DEEE|nr:hypothetical protein [uncultured Micrococcus sp.]
METNKVTIAELHHHYRRELGLSRRNADYLTRRVYKDAALAHATLPDRWAETLHPGPANLRPIERMTEAGNVGPDARPLMGREQHAAYQTLTRGRQRRAAEQYAREAVTAA